MKYERDLSFPLASTYGDDKKKIHNKNRKIYLENLNKFRNTHKDISNDKSHSVIVKRDKPLASQALKGTASKMFKRFKGG